MRLGRATAGRKGAPRVGWGAPWVTLEGGFTVLDLCPPLVGQRCSTLAAPEPALDTNH